MSRSIGVDGRGLCLGISWCDKCGVVDEKGKQGKSQHPGLPSNQTGRVHPPRRRSIETRYRRKVLYCHFSLFLVLLVFPSWIVGTLGGFWCQCITVIWLVIWLGTTDQLAGWGAGGVLTDILVVFVMLS